MLGLLYALLLKLEAIVCFSTFGLFAVNLKPQTLKTHPPMPSKLNPKHKAFLAEVEHILSTKS